MNATTNARESQETVDELVQRLSFIGFLYCPGFQEALSYFLALSPKTQDRLLRTGELGGDDE